MGGGTGISGGGATANIGSSGGCGESTHKEKPSKAGGGGEHHPSLRGSLSKTKKKKVVVVAAASLWNSRRNRTPSSSSSSWLVCLLLLGLGPLVVRRVWEGRRRFRTGSGNESHLQQPVKLSSSSGSTATGNNATVKTTTFESIRQEFYARYGGFQQASQMYERGVRRYGSLDATAERILRCTADRRPFVVSFAGYSVTVGRGNHYHQSFPFVLERILGPLIRDQLHGKTSLVVRNAAIGGIPSFPYGFCFEHFLGTDSSVVSWDYSMNEGSMYGAAVLESYVRHSQSQLSLTRPMIIALDTNPQRCQLLKSYADLGIVRDALCVGMAKDAVPDLKSRIQKREKDGASSSTTTIPEGFRDWDEFGAQPSCPGRGSWHPKKKEHELIGWNIAMYFASAVEKAIQIIRENPETWRATYRSDGVDSKAVTSPLTFPKPLSPVLPDNDESVTGLLYGHKVKGGDEDRYAMHLLSCRTNFLPSLNEDKVLPSIVASGLASDADPGSFVNQDILKERDDAQYRSGWVLDVSKVERDTKIKVDACGGLGYVDMKIALYGIPESGVLRLWLPVAAVSRKSNLASDYLQELVICEANEKRPERACRLDSDLSYTVGGAKVEAPTMIKGAAEYLKRSTCVHVGIPPQAEVTSLDNLVDANNRPISLDVRRRLEGNRPSQSVQLKMGLIVDVQVTGSVNRKDGACCISHVVWQHKSP